MSGAEKTEKCADRVDDEWADRRADLERLNRVGKTEDGTEWHEYGLCFDYVGPGTFKDQREGYWRYQFSWGGPSDELRFFVSPGARKPYRVEYWFLDWWDGAGVNVTGDAVAEATWDYFSEIIDRSEETEYREDDPEEE